MGGSGGRSVAGRRWVRTTAVLVALACVFAGSWSADAVPKDKRPRTLAVTWLTAQLNGGLLHYDTTAGPVTDLSLSAEAALALNAAGAPDATVIATWDALAAQAPAFIGTAPVTRAGATAQALLLSQAVRRNPSSFGGVDLVARLTATVSSSAPTVGRIVDQGVADTVDVAAQADAVDGLAQAGSAQSAAATGYLLLQQCAEGYFRAALPLISAADQSCEAGKAAGLSAPSTVATAKAILALRRQRSNNATVSAAVTRAAEWLKTTQAADGSFTENGVPTATATGYAGRALRTVGRTALGVRAAGWLRSLQADDVAPCSTALTGEPGVIAPGPAALIAARTDGIPAVDRRDWLAATIASVGVLAATPESSAALLLSGPPTTFVKANTRKRLTIDGLAVGERGCLSGPGLARAFTGTGASFVVWVSIPARTAIRTYTLTTGAETRSVALRALARRRLPVTLKKRVRRGGVQVVTVRSLAPGESVTIRFRGRKVAVGRAPSTGVFTGRFVVTGALGRAKIAVTGQFPGSRRNIKYFSVRRS